MHEARRRLVTPSAIESALRDGEPVRLLLTDRNRNDPEQIHVAALAEDAGVPVRALSTRALRRLVPHGDDVPRMLAVLGPSPRADLAELMRRAGSVWLLAGVAYPSNAGFAIRSAEASGAAGVVIDARWDRAARRDAARASMRTDRFLPVLYGDASTCLAAAREAGRQIVVIEEGGDTAPWQVDLLAPGLFVLGGEERGVAPSILQQAQRTISLPMHGVVPCYNLQAAMAAVIGEQLRQRALSG